MCYNQNVSTRGRNGFDRLAKAPPWYRSRVSLLS